MKQWNAIAQQTMPLVTALQQCAARSTAAFHTPGHKRGRGVDPVLQALLGDRVFRADLPELPELDNLFAPSGVIQQAQELAAQVFGAEQTWFLTNGSTSGVIAAILATCNPGDKIILPRNVHQSAISGLALSGAIPIFVNPEYDSHLALAHGVSPDAIAQTLVQHPDAKAVLIVSPTYYGVSADVAAIAQIIHQHSIPLLVDEAHGAHFGFHPNLPRSALQAGADLAVQSTHKTLSALTQAAMLHVQGQRINRDRLTKALALIQSTSPNYLLLASLDATRHQLATQGKELMAHSLRLATKARSRIAQIPELSLLDAEQAGSPGFFRLDPTRLTVTVSGLGITGFTADELLNEQLGIVAELPTLQHLTFIISLGNREEDIERLVHGLEWLEGRKPEAGGKREDDGVGGDKAVFAWASSLHSASPSPLSPREAFLVQAEVVSVEAAVGCVSAELVCPYPPGIPVLIPGEVITEEAIASLKQVLDAGGIISGCADPSLTTIKVIPLE
ncbi:MAG: aminotransferase class I/II-fold pyridoxal phosphate-dependent enzyme [Oscillatoriales cyanobacterium C42_A2020_001]|nr:aminotransferase class I/II-fold pyridoxal phosphate-dependent enzyme [Leptolyngbyaceae cyanobacterium C42_A2020_001]